MSTSVETLNIAFEQGTSFDLVYTWTGPDNVTPVNVTGYTAKMIVVSDYVNKTPLVLFNSAGGGTSNTSVTLGGAAGTVEVQATDAATAAMTWITGVYALIVQSPGGLDTKLLRGQCVVNPGLKFSDV